MWKPDMPPDPTRPRAVALRYDAERDDAPRVIAAGAGLTAEAIVALAQKHGVPIRHDPALVAALATLEVDSLIPPALYAVVAEVLAYVFRVKQRAAPPPTRPPTP